MDERHNARRVHKTQIDFPTILTGVKNYQDVQTTIAKTISEMREQGIKRFGFVSGRIGRGNENDPVLRLQSIKDDMAEMRKYTKYLQEKYGIPVISSVDIFDVVWDKLEETHLSQNERSARMKELFRTVLRNGVTDIFMMEGWKDAPGSVDEHETAREIGIIIHDPEPIVN